MHPGQPSLRARLKSAVVWNTCGTLLAQASTFLGNIVLANLLGKEVFGEFSLVQGTVVAFAGLAQLSAGYTASKYLPEFRSTNKARAERILGLCYVLSAATGCAGGVLLWAGASWLAEVAVRAPQLTTYFKLLALFVPFTVMTGSLNGILAGLESFRSIARSAIVYGLGYLCLCGLGALKYGILGATAGLIAAAALQWFLTNRMVLREAGQHGIRMDMLGMRRELAVLWSFSVPAILSGLLATPSVWFASVCLARQPDGFSQVALFSAAASLKGVVMFLPNNLNTVILSLMNNHLKPDQRSQYKKVFLAGLIGNAAVVVLGVLGALLFGPIVLRAYGKSFAGGYWVLVLVLVAALPEALAIAVYQVVQSRAQMWRSLFLITMPRAVALAAAAFLLTRSYGARGLAAAYGGSWFFCLLCCWWVAAQCWQPATDERKQSGRKGSVTFEGVSEPAAAVLPPS